MCVCVCVIEGGMQEGRSVLRKSQLAKAHFSKFFDKTSSMLYGGDRNWEKYPQASQLTWCLISFWKYVICFSIFFKTSFEMKVVLKQQLLF